MTWLEYPKWVGEKIVASVEEEAEALGVKVKDVVRQVAPDVEAIAKAAETFLEYPKWVLGKIVNTAEEELAAMMAEDNKAEANVEAAMRDDAN